MGITISYRGSLKDINRVEDFEDRVLDLVLEFGGQARIWRTSSDNDPNRVVRGIVLNLYPGQETTSLLISPEGWLINLCEIEEAEKGQLAEPPWCFVKTQFGPVEGHVALIEMLTALKQEFLPNLEVHDEGEYWETRNLATLTAKMRHLQAAINALAEGLDHYGLSSEAAEDQEILAARIERIARLVQRTLARPAEHPPVHWDDDDSGGGEMEGDESRWDASFKENRRRQEHVHRAIEEHLADGENIDEAFDAAMQEETALGLPEESSEELPDDGTEDFTAEDDEPWRESLPEAISETHEDRDLADRPRHPLLRRASDLMLRLNTLLATRTEVTGSHQDVLLHGAGEMLGGLAQALGSDDFRPLSGLSVVQLKRALRGAAFALGALFPLRTEAKLDEPAFEELRDTIEALQTDMFAELSHLRQRNEDEC
jgi:hypothetical protein